MPSEAIAGPPSGSTTRVKSRISPAPSSRAASSSSRGISAKKFRSRKIANGSPKADVEEDHAETSSRRCPMLPNSLATGISATCTGTTSSPTTTRNHQSRPGNSIQAKAYPASAPMTTTSDGGRHGDQHAC